MYANMQVADDFIHEHPKNCQSWRVPEVQSLASDPRVYSIDGPMFRWSMKARRSNNKEEFMRKQTRWLTLDDLGWCDQRESDLEGTWRI